MTGTNPLAKLVSIQDEGSIVLVTPQTEAVQEWFDDHVLTPDTMMWGEAVVVDRRYAYDLLSGLLADFPDALDDTTP